MAYRDEVREFVIEKYKDNYSVKAIQQLLKKENSRKKILLFFLF